NRQGTREAFRRLQPLHPPTCRLFRLPFDPQQPRRLTRREGDVEFVERARQPIPRRLDERLFACPAPEERPRPLRGRQTSQLRALARREVALGDRLCLRYGPFELQIDSELTFAREGEQGEAARVRHVEAHPVGPGIRRQVWFATRPVGEE